MSIFNLDINDTQDLIFEVKISGELKRGWDIEENTTLMETLSTAVQKSKSKLIIFDLSALTFWDTMGITKILDAIIYINKMRSLRAGIISPTDEMLFIVAKQKYSEVGTKLIPWEDSKEKVIEFLSS